MDEIYRVRSHGIAHETIAGETVVLNLDTGTYFSLSGAANLGWSLLQQGAGATQLAAALKHRYHDAAIDAAVAAFIAELQREGMIESLPGGAAGEPPLHDGPREPFPGLGIERYTDIQELLLIDPVHEVGDRGWPNQADPG